MKQHYFKHLNTAKCQQGYYRQEVEAAIATSAFERVNALKTCVESMISDLKDSREFFKRIGKKHEADVFVIYYTTLLHRLNSS